MTNAELSALSLALFPCASAAASEARRSGDETTDVVSCIGFRQREVGVRTNRSICASPIPQMGDDSRRLTD